MSKQQGDLDLSQFENQVAVVTGAGNNGIGWGIAKHAALELGMHVVLVDLHSSVVESACERLRELVGQQQVIGVQCDVTKTADLERCVQDIKEKIPEVFLIYCFYFYLSISFSAKEFLLIRTEF